MTHNHHENLSMMDSVTTKYGKTTVVTVSRTLAIILLILFFICLIATGLLVYSFTSICPKNDTSIETDNNPIEKSVSEQISSGAIRCNSIVSDHRDIISSSGEDSISKDGKNIDVVDTVASTTNSPKTDLLNVHTKDLDIRLTRSILPHSYVLHLIPFIEEGNFTFHGKVTILINVTEASTSVTLHANTLSIDIVNVMNINKQTVSVKDVKILKRKEFLVIDLDGVLEAGQQYYVYIEFRGVLNDLLQGFYRSSYVENNETRWIAATQFQPTDARKAFPCFDEPSFKAKFQINVARPKNMSSISNMPQIDTTEDVENLPNYVWDHFQESLPMSTYLVAIVVSDFNKISKGLFNIWARPSALSQARFSLEIGPQILRYYEKFFGIEYPLPKMDMVAIPDFSAGAMENWGLITYREPVLLYQKGISSTASKQSIAHVVAHELAHQWFGNLVTPVWWEDLWLNEGFATYVEFLGANAVNPKWKDLDLFLVSELHEALSLDALKSSHPIYCKVNHPDEIGDIFDRISYSKGASIIRMMKNFLGDQAFHLGLHEYLKSRMYSSAEQDDLWHTLTQQTWQAEPEILPENTTVKEIMDTWTLQTGYPVVTALRERNSDLVISQKRFLLTGNQERDDTLWWVPVTILDSDDIGHEVWLKKEKEITMKNVILPGTSWFLVNIFQNGYYRVNYDEQNWMMLINQLQNNGHHLINPKNRAQMLDDALNLASTGYLSYDIALNVTVYLTNEREFVPWKAALTNLDFLHDMFVRSSDFDKFKIAKHYQEKEALFIDRMSPPVDQRWRLRLYMADKDLYNIHKFEALLLTYMISLLSDFYRELTFKESPNEDPIKVLNRMEIINQACKLGLKDCVLQAVQQFQNWKNSASPDKENVINPDLRQTVYCTAISDGGQDEWDFAWNRYINTNVATHKEILLTSLACSKEIWILSRYLEWSITENSGIRKHDTARVFASVSENPVGHDLVYRFLKTNWQRIRTYLGPSSMSVSSIVRTSTEKFNTEEEVNDFKSFFERKQDEFGIALRTAQQSIEQGEANIRWMKNYYTTVKKWLENVKIISII